MELSLIIDLYEKCLPTQKFWLLISQVFDAPFYIVLIGLIYWTMGRKEGFKFATFIVLNNVINQSLKSLFMARRPFQRAPHVLHIKEPGYGFPSGHAQNAALTWTLFYKVMSKGLRLGCLLLVVLIAFSRVALGVHYIHQVIVGLLVGYLLGLLFRKISYESLEILLHSHYTIWLMVLSLVSIEIIQSTMAFGMPAGLLNAFRQVLILMSGYLGIMMGQRQKIEGLSPPASAFGWVLRVLVGLMLTAIPLLVYMLIKLWIPIHGIEAELKSLSLIGAGYIMSYQCFKVFRRLKI